MISKTIGFRGLSLFSDTPKWTVQEITPNGWWSLSLLNSYFIGNIPHFQTYPYHGINMHWVAPRFEHNPAADLRWPGDRIPGEIHDGRWWDLTIFFHNNWEIQSNENWWSGGLWWFMMVYDGLWWFIMVYWWFDLTISFTFYQSTIINRPFMQTSEWLMMVKQNMQHPLQSIFPSHNHCHDTPFVPRPKRYWKPHHGQLGPPKS